MSTKLVLVLQNIFKIKEHMISSEHLQKAMSYSKYIELLEKLLAEGKTTGLTQNEEYLNYAKINLQRMRRLYKTTVLTNDLSAKLDKLQKKYVFLILTEGWCGDAAQNIPIFEKMAEHCDHVEVKLLLRDENEFLMNKYLTNGSKSIPKVICLEKETLVEKFVWGPRPATLQVIVQELIKQHKTLEEKGLFVQDWYNKDKTLSTQKEIASLLEALQP